VSTEIGRRAEEAAANYLEKQGFRVLERNWHNRFCEVDIVAQKDGEIHLIEVKYRRSDTSGSGFEYITPAKLDRMKRAALAWEVEHNWEGPVHLGVLQMEESGKIDFIEDITL
jgi:putative endonuclease